MCPDAPTFSLILRILLVRLSLVPVCLHRSVSGELWANVREAVLGEPCEYGIAERVRIPWSTNPPGRQPVSSGDTRSFDMGLRRQYVSYWLRSLIMRVNCLVGDTVV